MSPAHHLFPQWLGSAAQPGEQAQPERTRRLVVLGLLLLNGLVVALCVALLVGSRQHDLANARLEALTDARLTAQAADAMFDKATIALGAVAAQVERQLRGAGFDAATLWQVVDAQAGQVAEIDRIGLFDEQGAQRCGVPIERCQHLDVSDRPYFQRLHDHPEDPVALYGPYAIRPGGQPALVLAQPLRLQGGGFGGVAIAVLPLDRLRHLVTTARMGSSGSVSLRSTGLGLLVRTPELTGADALETGQRVSDTLRAALAASPAEGAYVGVTANDGIERVTAYHRLARQPVLVLVGRATDDLLAPWRQLAGWTAGFLLLFAGVSWQLGRATAHGLQREAHALALYDQAPCGYHTLDAQGVYRSVNATELAWLGCTRSEVVGRLKPMDFCTDEGRATFAENFPRLMETGRVEGLEYDLIGRDGTARRMLVNATAVRDGQGRFLHSNSVMHDITALHEARRQLRAVAQEQGVMLDNALIGMVKLKDRRTVWKNQAMDRIFGYSGAEWDGLPSRALYFDDTMHQRTGQELREAFAQGRTYRIQLPMRHKDGHTVWIDASGAPLACDGSEVLMMLADITPLKAAEDARVRSATLEAQNLQLRETSRLKSEFVSNMSHELRTPLTAILGFGQMLQSGTIGPDSPKFSGYLGRIVGSGRQLLALIEQVLDYGKVEAGRMVFEPQPVNLAQALHEVVELLHAESAARGVVVRIDVDDGIESAVADPVRLRQMLLALVGNAIKFSHTGGQVEVRALAVDDAFWQVAVTDHGIGIADADLPRLFSPFVQLSSGPTKTHGGTGIGLALVRLLVQAQGGRIEVHSQPGVGSRFVLTLPRVLGTAA